jgi:hypothetical protein
MYSKEETLINKVEQGLIMTLDGKANAAHLGNIYNYDEDDNTNIFIPYLYMSSASRNLNNIDIDMERTFKGNNQERFTIVPINDAFGTPLCECQREMLLEKIQQNLTRRNAVLSFIAREIVFRVNAISVQNSEIKKWSNAKVDQSHLKSLHKQLTLKIEECKTYVKKIEKLNSDIQTEEKNLNNKTQEGQKKDGEIQIAVNNISIFRNEFMTQTVNNASVSKFEPQQKMSEAIAYFTKGASQYIDAARNDAQYVINTFPRDRSVKSGNMKGYVNQMNETTNNISLVRMKIEVTKVEAQLKSDISRVTILQGKFDEILAEKK